MWIPEKSGTHDLKDVIEQVVCAHLSCIIDANFIPLANFTSLNPLKPFIILASNRRFSRWSVWTLEKSGTHDLRDVIEQVVLAHLNGIKDANFLPMANFLSLNPMKPIKILSSNRRFRRRNFPRHRTPSISRRVNEKLEDNWVFKGYMWGLLSVRKWEEIFSWQYKEG